MGCFPVREKGPFLWKPLNRRGVVDQLTIQPRFSPKAVKRYREMTPAEIAEEELRNYCYERDLEMEIESELHTAVENEPRSRRYAKFLGALQEEHKQRLTRLGDYYNGEDPSEEDF